jgi:eukaryotic-like serine/threonine-protein kinase
MIDPGAPNSADDAVGPVLETFLARFRRGERPSLTELIARHPDLAEQLQEIIPALVELEQLGDPTGSFSGSGTASVAAIADHHPESLGDYKILRWIGGGGMGTVYEAEHQSLKSRVALKVMHPRFRADEKYLRRFHVEARSAAGLHHTNIVGVFDYGEQDGVCYYAMQYIRGQPLDSVLADLRRLRASKPGPEIPEPRGDAPTIASWGSIETANRSGPSRSPRGANCGQFPAIRRRARSRATSPSSRAGGSCYLEPRGD